ncbi:MAG TPA: hypothetical protein VFQ48_08910, partial [Pseudonocardiaceae bacterium]|nr:hypothetical protein [Pseudonocardiaceae bacterium]
TARTPAAVISAATRDRLGLVAGGRVVLSTDSAAVSLPWMVGDIADDVVWAPTNSAGVNLHRDLRATAGAVVHLRPGALQRSPAITVNRREGGAA